MRLFVFVALALLCSFAAASTATADESSLTDLINSLEDNLDMASLDELEEEDDLATARNGSGSGSGSGGGDLTANFPPVVQEVFFPTRNYNLQEYAGYVDVHVELRGGAVSTDSVFNVHCTESAPANGEPWNYTPRIATCPDTITVPAGQKTATIQLYAFDNDLVDGDQTITIGLTYNSGSVPTATPPSYTTVKVWDDDKVKPEPVVVDSTRCDPRLPLQIAIRYFGDRLANQYYDQMGARGVYYCTYVGKTRNNWAFGIRSVASYRNTNTLGAANRWQLWWNQHNTAGGGQIRYESIARKIVDGLNGPYVPVNGFKPAGQITTTKVSDATTYACLSVTGAGTSVINQFYRWEYTGTQFVRFRGATNTNIVLIAAPANKVDFNSGYWYFVSRDSYVPYYKSEHRGGPPTGTYLKDSRAEGTGVPVVTISSGCPAVVDTRSCKVVAAQGSTHYKVNQTYRMKTGVTGRLTIFVGETYNAWSISHYTLGSEPWSDFWFISYQARQIYYANKRGLPIVSSYYAVTTQAGYQGTVKVTNIGCPL